MTRYFIPYSQNNPAAIEIKGHRLILLGTDREVMLPELPLLGSDRVQEIEVRDGDVLTQSMELSKLAASVNGGIVLTPKGVSISSMIRNLEHQLPWLH